MNKICVLSGICLLFLNSLITGQNYSVDAIPDSLKENAHSVIRDYSDIFELKSSNSGVENIRMAITVLDRGGEKAARLILPYDKDSGIDINQITIFDRNGKKVKTVKQSEIEDYPAFMSFELFSDNRVKHYQPSNPEFPYTIVYEYEDKQTNLISLGHWMPVSNYNLSVQHASLTLIHPADVKIRKKEMNIKVSSSEVQNNLITEKWELNNVMAIEDEPFGVSISDRVASVYLMPEILIFDKYKGKADTWENYGQWVFDLYKGRDELLLDDNIKVTALLVNVADTLERIRILYKYLQENTRYIAVTLGIGGFQPYDAKTVYQTGYGECKALSNYMCSLLKFAGIVSYPALVAAGSYKTPIFRDFPNFSQFNHVIVCVPRGSDTIWLECTDQKIPLGFLGDFTDNRDALLLTQKGGRFAHTIRYDANDNLRSSRSEFTIDTTGAATGIIKTSYRGLQYDNLASFLRSGYDEQKKFLYSHSGLPSAQIKEFSVKENKERIPGVKIIESVKSNNYCSFSGKYMILPLNLINVQKAVQKMVKTRYSDIMISRSSIDWDTIIYRLPNNYYAESLPKGTNLKSDFGTYSFNVSSNGKEIIYSRKFEITGGRHKAIRYKEFYDFILSISKTDNQKILLTKTPPAK
jgi:hypothetical protein